MDVKPKVNDQHPASDDQELAKVLADVGEQVEELPVPVDATASGGGLQFGDSPVTTPAADDNKSADAAAVAADNTTVDTPAADVTLTEPTPAPDESPSAEPAATSNISPALEGIKKDALEELRPLVTKLDLPADEKFDTMLLIIRSTDDQSLVTEAYEAAKAITDEKKRAEALLDIIKEIDYFGSHAA